MNQAQRRKFMKCLNCSKPVDKKTRPMKDRVVICTHCGELMQLNADLTLRKADAETIEEMKKDEKLWQVLTDIRKTYCNDNNRTDNM